MARQDPAVIALLPHFKNSSAEGLTQLVAEVTALGSEGLPALRRAARGSKQRARRRVDVLLALGDAEPGGPADDEVRELLGVRDESRDWLVQGMKRRPRFIPELRAIARDADDPEWAWAVDALGELGDRGSVEILMAHTAGQDTPFVLLDALRKLKDPIAALVFESNLTHPEPRTRVFALWGLAALGHATPIAGLVALLDDPDVRTPTSYEPGESRRAAQALCDVLGWPFEWAPEAVEATRERVRARFSAEYLAACAEALARGYFELPGPDGAA
ncbi:HEAT repeat domain-containing protein [Nannocystis pusilla]|uniref:HEAT repeat domain-containing protein n=1 Tax=Nannocystis pusilla TaxID=889268 RepID=UPI003BF2F559